ncbi:ABC transporter ATP-binding protein [Planctomycetota bacterium]
MIVLDHISKRFGKNLVLTDINFKTECSKIYALQGRNGAGKTTLIRIALGLLPADSGTVRVLDKDPQSNWAVRQKIGVVCDDDAYFPELTVEEYLWWVGRLRSLTNAACKKQIDELTRAFYLYERQNHAIRSLSHGMQRKMLIASAFIGSPKLIVMDEPTSGLDAESLDVLANLLQEHACRGNTALLSCHDKTFVKNTCTDIVVLDGGRTRIVDKVKYLSDAPAS